MAPPPESPSVREKNPWLAALASALVPGLGQLYAGQRQRGIRLLIIDAGLIAIVIVGLLFFRGEVAKIPFNLDKLVWLMVGNLVLLAYRAWAADDAYKLVARQSTASAAAMFAGFASVLLIVLAPHVLLGVYDLVQYRLIDNTFAEEDVAAAPATSVVVAGDEVAGEGSVTATTDVLVEPPIWDGLERLNILLLGGDSGVGRTGIRTDTTILLSIDPVTGDAAMFSVPRDLSGIELPEGMGIWDCNCFPALINDLYIAAEDNPEAFPGPQDPGVNAVKAAVGKLFGLEVHYYALVTLDGFVGIVDALGGVTIDVPFTIVDEIYPHEDGVTIEHVEIPAGENHLDGHLALAYARIRRHANDFARMNRQRCLIEAVLEQSNPIELAAAYPRIAGVLEDSLITDIPQDRLEDFIEFLPKVSTDRIASLRITRDVYKIGSATGRTYYDQERIREDAQALLADPESASAALGLESLDDTCGGS